MSSSTRFQLLSLFCLCTPLVAQGGEHDLKVAAKKGSTVWLLLEEKQEQSIDMGGQTMEMGNTTTRTLNVTVKEVDDKGNVVAEVKIARIHGSMTIPMMGDIDFDSAKKSEDAEEGGGEMGFSPAALTKTMTAMAGKSFLAKLDASGKVSSLEGVAELLKEANKGPKGPGAAMGAATESQFKQYVESAFGTLPDKPMAQGATWNRVDAEQSARGAMQTKLQFTLAKVDAESFEVTATGTIETSAPPKSEVKAEEGADPVRDMAKSMKVKNGKVIGTQRVSRQDGFVIESSNVTSMDIDMAGPMGGEMSMSTKVTTKTKRTTAEAAMPKQAAKVEKTEPGKEAGK